MRFRLNHESLSVVQRDSDTRYWPPIQASDQMTFPGIHPALSLQLFKSGATNFMRYRMDPRVPSRYNSPYSVRVYTAPSCTRVARVQRQVKVNRPRGSADSRLHNDTVWASGTCLTRSLLPSAPFSIAFLLFFSLNPHSFHLLPIFNSEKN